MEEEIKKNRKKMFDLKLEADFLSKNPNSDNLSRLNANKYEQGQVKSQIAKLLIILRTSEIKKNSKERNTVCTKSVVQEESVGKVR